MDEIIGDVREFREDPNRSLKIPTNVKQIGNIEGTLQVYLEDFVYSYLKDYSSMNTSQEQVAILLGRYYEQGKDQYLLITGALRGYHTTVRRGSVVFTEQTWEKVYQDKEKYFPEEEMVGWVRSQPGFGVFLSGYDVQFHQTFFRDPYQLIYVIDPVEKTDAFFEWEDGQAKKMPGYFIYYDKNALMHDYMMDHRLVAEKKEKQPTEEFIRAMRNHQKVKATKKEFKEKINGLAGFSIAMVLICGVMGFQLLKLQGKYDNMYSKYANLTLQMESLSKEAQQAFNPSKPNVSQNNNTSKPSVKPVQKPTVKPAVKPTPKPTVKYSSYTVKKGDTLLGIVLHTYGDANKMKEIMAINNITKSSNIRIGQILKLPSK